MKVLFGTDGSRYSLAAARFLAHWLRLSGARVDLVTAVAGSPLNPRRRYGKRESLEDRWRTVAERWQGRTAKPLESHGHRVERMVRRGHPSRVLPEMAATGEYDLVVAGAKGRGQTPFFDVGSVARALLEHAPTPVLMIRERDPKGRGRQQPSFTDPFRILIPTDGKPHSSHAARWFLGRFRIENAELDLVTAAEELTSEAVGALPPEERSRVRGEAEKSARKRLNALANELGAAPPPTNPRLLEGRPAEAVVAAAEADEADLIVLGSRGGGEVPERRMGSVALEIARSAPCSILVVRESAPLGEPGT